MLLVAPAGRISAAEDPLTLQLKSVADVDLEGRKHVKAGEIWPALKTKRPSWIPWADRIPLRLDYVRADTLAIASIYRQHGYLDASVDVRVRPGRHSGTVVVVYEIHEGPRSKIANVELAGVNAYPQDQLRKKLYSRPGRAFNPAYLVVDTSLISSLYQDRGYLPHVTGAARRESLSVDVRYDVTEGKMYRFGDVYLSTPGEVHVKENLIRRELLIKHGEVYRRPRVERSIERLYETGLFSQVQMTALPDSANAAINVDLRVRERKFRWVDAGVGSGTSERLATSAEWGHRNLGGTGVLGSIIGRAALDRYGDFLNASIEARLVEPWLFRTRTRGAVSGYQQRRDDRSDPKWVIHQSVQGITFGIDRELNRFTRLGINQDNQWVKQSLGDLDPQLPDSTKDRLESQTRASYTTHLIQFSLTRDLRDSPFTTTRGSMQVLSAEVAGGPLQGTSSFRKYQLISSWYTPQRTGSVFGARIRAGLIEPFGDRPPFTPGVDVDPEVARVPTEYRFRLGGVNSIRGYDENSIPPGGGLVVLAGTIEMRVPLKGPFGLELYADAGNVWDQPEQVRFDQFIPSRGHDALGEHDVRYVFGFGPRMNLPIGPLRMDFTWSLRPTADRAALVAERQFAIGPSF